MTTKMNCHCQDNAPNDNAMDNSIIDDLSDFFKVLGDSTRMKVLLALDDGEMCVYHISEELDMSMSAVSHQLRILRDAKLVTSRRDGKNIYYSLCDDHVKTIVETAFEHVSEKD